jgi:photosystem II stability/assembly factor-like uncharacterized protein
MKKIFAAITIFVFIFSQNLLAQGWQWIDTGFPDIIFDMSFPPGQSDIGFAVGSNLTFGGDGIILKTTDGGSSWSKISTDTIPGLKAACFTSADVGYAAGHQNFLMKTIDGGSTWTQIVIDTKLWYFNNIEFWDANNGIVASYPSSVYRTTDAGATWNLSSIGLKHSIEDLCYADANTLYLVGGDETIYKSTNSGFFWTEIYSGFPLSLLLSVEFYNPSYGIVAGEDGKVFVTTNGGTDWATSNAGGVGLMRGVHLFDEENAYVVGTPEQVFKTTNGGITWVSDFNGANTVALYKIKFTENNTGLICGSQGKFLINTDYVPVELTGFAAIVYGNDVQLNWTTKSELNNSGFEILRSVENNNWENIAFVPGFGTASEPKTYYFTDAELKSGFYSYRLKQIDFDGSFEYSDIVNVFVSSPIGYSLEQNYPNPFNPNTLIKFSISNEVQVSLSVFNILGEKVKELKNEIMKPGYYEVEFNASSLASGVYSYRIKAGDFVETKKMVLLR